MTTDLHDALSQLRKAAGDEPYVGVTMDVDSFRGGKSASVEYHVYVRGGGMYVSEYGPRLELLVSLALARIDSAKTLSAV